MHVVRRLFGGWTLLMGGAVLACSSTSSSAACSCGILAVRCHPIKTPLDTACHDLGHNGDDSKCNPRLAVGDGNAGLSEQNGSRYYHARLAAKASQSDHDCDHAGGVVECH